MTLKYFVLIILSAIVSVTLAVPTNGQTGANATWRVQKYDLNVALPQDDKSRIATIRAILSVKNVSGAPVGSLTLRIAPSAEVTAVKINDATVDFAKAEEKVNAGTTLQRIGIRFGAVPAEAVVTASVEYRLTIKENSGIAAISPTGSQFLPLSFWYPTPNSWFFTKGADAAPFTVAVSGVTDLVTAGPKLNGQPFFVSGSWDMINANGISVYAPKGGGADAQKRASELAALMSDAKTFIEGLLGKAPDVPLKIVASRRGAGFSSAGTVIVDDAVFRRPRIDSLTAMNIAEAVTKLWLVNNVRLGGEGHGVIGEGLSRYIATQFLESKYGKDVADVERLRQRTAYAAVSKRDAPMATVSPIDDYYYPVVANKGAMVWRILAKRVGTTEFYNSIRSSIADGDVSLGEMRSAFSSQKDLIDYFLDQVTDMNLLAGIPQAGAGETKVALRNTGATDVTVDVVGTTSSNERLTATATIRATSFGDVSFKTPNKIVRVEVDADKLYPQMDYSDDVAPRETTDSDPLLAAKRLFDTQDYAGAERTARTLLAGTPRFDELRVLLGRSLLGQGRTADAEKEFRAILDEKLPTARSMAWANEGLAEIASKAGQTEVARKAAETAIMLDADYGASFAARTLRSKLGISTAVDPGIKTFFTSFDAAAAANRKADIDQMVVSGEVAKFASSLAGSTELWQTQITQVDMLDPNTALVEANMNIKLLTRNPESGLAVYRLVRVGNVWRLAAVEIFEVR